MTNSFVLKGSLGYSLTPEQMIFCDQGYVVCENGLSAGVYESLPEKYKPLPIYDYGEKLIIPGLVDLHVHGSQFGFRGLGMDMELIQWLETNTFPEEAKFSDLDYAKRAYEIFTNDLIKGPNTRACVFGTIHREATELLMDLLEQSGLFTYVGKVNMDRNSPDNLREETKQSAEETIRWIEDIAGKYERTKPILSPRFIPSCSNELMKELHEIQVKYKLPVQSHLSENKGEITWVQELRTESHFYGEAYYEDGLFGGDCPTIMAHCVHSTEDEIALMKKQGVYIAHCPQSNTNLSSGIAPVRKYLQEGMKVGLGSDVAGGCYTSILVAMRDAIWASKMREACVDNTLQHLTMEEAFYLGTKGGGAFFGKVGSFEEGYEFDAVILNDESLPTTINLDSKRRLERMIYLSDDRHIEAKYIQGRKIQISGGK